MDKGPSKKSWEYIDFELEVRKGGPGDYTVRVLHSPAGEPQAKMHLPFSEGEMEDKLKDLEETLNSSGEETRSGKTQRGPRQPKKRVIQDLGQSLFRALLYDPQIYASYSESLNKAKQQEKGLRLKLRVEPSELARLPWEFLYDPGRQEFVCEYRTRTLVRYLEVNLPVEELRVKPPLRILGMVASPLDLDLLNVEREIQRVERDLKALQDAGLVKLKWVKGETYQDLEREMWDDSWHVFHFIGHGDFDSYSEQGALALADKAGRTDLLRADDLATLLVDSYDLKLVFLNSCVGARSSEGDAFSSTAATLVRRGIPAVVAMQYEITDGAAIAFSQAFYEEVAKGSPVDAAIARGRTSVKKSSYNSFEWGTPVLYMRSRDGRIFDIKEHPTTEVSDNEYRSDLKQYWQDGKLSRAEAERLANLKQDRGLSLNVAASIEREVLGDTLEGVLKIQRNHYARVLRVGWRDRDPDARRHLADQMPRGVFATLDRLVTDSTLTPAAALNTLRSLADELGLGEEQAAEVEREVLGRTVERMLYAKPEELPP